VITHFFTFPPGGEALGTSYFTYAGSISEPVTTQVSDLWNLTPNVRIDS
jgi:hypothetical protein